eukprot:m.57159 g.57159  ORF g.57159 m.57159 type:complete len:100 (+) comp12707_c0_seq1:1123-1422(+)
MADDLETRFNKAVWLIRNGPPIEGGTNEQKLTFYKLYKQATVGDVTGSQPWAVQLEARAKWDAWASIKGMAKEEAMRQYIALLGDDWESHEKLAEYSAE